MQESLMDDSFVTALSNHHLLAGWMSQRIVQLSHVRACNSASFVVRNCCSPPFICRENCVPLRCIVLQGHVGLHGCFRGCLRATPKGQEANTTSRSSRPAALKQDAVVLVVHPPEYGCASPHDCLILLLLWYSTCDICYASTIMQKSYSTYTKHRGPRKYSYH